MKQAQTGGQVREQVKNCLKFMIENKYLKITKIKEKEPNNNGNAYKGRL